MALLGDDLRPLIGDSVSRYEGNGNFAKGDASESDTFLCRRFRRWWLFLLGSARRKKDHKLPFFLTRYRFFGDKEVRYTFISGDRLFRLSGNVSFGSRDFLV
jgi:hypothetical protein